MERPSVLIVEKDSEVGHLEAAVVQRAGCCVGEVAGNGLDALVCLERNPPEVLILGSPVEVEHGVLVLDLLADRLRQFARRTIVLTAFVDSATLLQRALKAGVFAVVAKPFDVDIVCEVISRCAENAGAAGEVTWIGVKDTVLERLRRNGE